MILEPEFTVKNPTKIHIPTFIQNFMSQELTWYTRFFLVFLMALFNN